MKNFIYLGIDQTGAVDLKGRPRPLPACLIRGKLVYFFYLSTFSKEEIVKKIQPLKNETILICVDCVLGLPDGLKTTWRQALEQIKKSKSYGRQAAKDFFQSIGKNQILKRKIEIACNANSVFTEKPYQKNIQTGTYRIWKDISADENNFFAPALETRSTRQQIAIYEGYPSLSWALLFDSRTRKPKKLSQFIKDQYSGFRWNRRHQACVEQDVNLADAFVLALSMQKFQKLATDFRPQNEGSILGFEE